MTSIYTLSATHQIPPQLGTLYHDLPEDPADEIEGVEPPKLTPPEQVSSTYRFLDAINGICDLRESMMKTTTLCLETMKTEIEEASANLIEKLRQAATQAKSSNFWSLLKKVADCLLSTLSSVFGLSFLFSGANAIVGGAMLVSGVLSLANLILSECKGWDWITSQLSYENEESRQKLLLYLPTAVGLIAGGFSLLGSVYGITSGALDFAQKAGSIAQTTLSLFSGVTHLGKGVADAKLTWTQTELEKSQEDLKIKQNEFGRFSDDINATLEEFNRTFQQAKRAVRCVTQTQSQPTR